MTEDATAKKSDFRVCVGVSSNWKHDSSIHRLRYDFVVRFNFGAVRVAVISPFLVMYKTHTISLQHGAFLFFYYRIIHIIFPPSWC